MWNKIANIVLKNRWFIVAIIVILTIFFGYFAFTSLRVDNRYGNMLPKVSKTQSDFLKFKEKFGEDGSTLVIAIKEPKLYTEKKLLKWKELGDSILQFNGVESVISEATLLTLKNNTLQKRFEAHRIFSDVKFKEKTIKQIEQEIHNNPIFDKLLYNDSSNISLMMIGLDERYLRNQKKSVVVLEIEKLAQTYEPIFGKIHFAGLPHMRIVIGKKVMNEMFIFIGLAIAATSLLLYLFFRSIRVVIVCNSVVFVSVIWALGSIGLFGFDISLLMALIPPLMIVIGIPNCIFLITKFHQEYQKTGSQLKAIYLVITKIGVATFLTNLTTALGFATFMFTNSEKLIEFGFIASLNIMLVFVLSLCIIPVYVTFLKPPKERHLKHLDRKFAQGFIEKIVYVISFKRKWVYGVTIALVVINIFGLVRIKATGNLTGDLPKDDPIYKDIKFIEKHFGGAIPFEIMINYKQKGRLLKSETLQKIEKIQTNLKNDSMFSKSISIVDFMKVINMAYYNNNPEHYRLIANRDKLRLKKYVNNFDVSNVNINTGSLNLKELVDTSSNTLRIRTQIKDIGSYEVATKVKEVQKMIEEVLNPNQTSLKKVVRELKSKNELYLDTLIYNHPGVFNHLTSLLSSGDPEVQSKFDLDPMLIKKYMDQPTFNQLLQNSVENEKFDVDITGTSVVVSEGTQYLVNNLLSSIVFAVISIAVLMAILFRSWRMVMISLIPNIVPMIITSGIMGWFGIPLKPSTLLVFSIAFGISVDDTIHYLTKYRQELKHFSWDIKTCVIQAIRESGLGMFYTSVVLFCGFSVFTFSQFGGTQALGLLISITLLVAMITNLVVLPSLLLSLDRIVTTKSFREPYFDIYDEEVDYNSDKLEIIKHQENIL